MTRVKDADCVYFHVSFSALAFVLSEITRNIFYNIIDNEANMKPNEIYLLYEESFNVYKS